MNVEIAVALCRIDCSVEPFHCSRISLVQTSRQTDNGCSEFLAPLAVVPHMQLNVPLFVGRINPQLTLPRARTKHIDRTNLFVAVRRVEVQPLLKPPTFG